MFVYLITRFKNNLLEYYHPRLYHLWSEHRELAYQYLHQEHAFSDLYSLPEFNQYSENKKYSVIESDYQIFPPIIPSLDKLKQEHLTKSPLYICRCKGKILGDYNIHEPYFDIWISNFYDPKYTQEVKLCINDGDDFYFEKQVNSVEEGFEVLEELITRTPIFVYKDLDKSWKAS